MYQVDLNSDLGESFGNYTLEANDEIMRHVSSANVACGLHAGDPVVMAHTVALAKEYGVGVGAHPSYPDLQGFGRRRMISPSSLNCMIVIALCMRAISWVVFSSKVASDAFVRGMNSSQGSSP